MNKHHSLKYRKDIDGLRAIAVLAVIFFHFGYFTNGYLGVDIFFVISGFLITSIIYKSVLVRNFSIKTFYLKRIRRIFPLVFFTSATALVIGYFTMLPDDLENLSASIVATNFFANNILQLITTGNYWFTINDFKPLMHTWSLGIEEQFYIVYPFLFLFLKKKNILPILIILTFFSAFGFLLTENEYYQFYLMPYRFFELSIGGIGAIVCLNKKVSSHLKAICLVLIIFLLCVDISIPKNIIVLVLISSTLIVLLESEAKNKLLHSVLENKIMIGLGKISFSLYMWHQIVLAFTRYIIKYDFKPIDYFFIFGITVVLSILSYNFIEQPFRNKEKVSNTQTLLITGISFLLLTGTSFYFYATSGIIKDIPELDITKNKTPLNYNVFNTKKNPHISYNARIYDYDKEFTSKTKIKVLVIGNSFARDWANVLLESNYASKIELSYIENSDNLIEHQSKFDSADYIFFSAIKMQNYKLLRKQLSIDSNKVWNVGLKNFGVTNGIFYNAKKDTAYYKQRTIMAKSYFEDHLALKKEWNERYIDLIALVIDNKKTVPVFTPNHKYISHDCKHFTKNGALYFVELLKINEGTIFK